MPDPRPATAAVASRILDDLDRVVRRMGEAYQAEVPEYASLTEQEMTGEVLPTSRAIVERFFEAVRHGLEPRVDDIPEVERMGRRRLEMGIPLEPMLHVYRIAGRTVWDAMVSATPPGEERVLAEVGGAWMDYIDRASSAAATSYLDASHERLRRIDAHRGALLEALLAAVDPSDVAAVAVEFATSFASTYQPVLIAGEGVASRIDAVTATCPAGTIGGFRGTHVVVLVPDGLPDLGAVEAVAGPATVAYGRPSTPGSALTAELRHTDVLLTVALGVGHHGTYGPDDLIVPQLVAGSPRVAETLARRVLRPLRRRDRDGFVEATLRSYLRTGSVPTTAARELVHANTVAYRLRRVTDATGLDPRVPADAVVLALALEVDDMPPML